jgi:Flp pilus assembly protein TadD
MLALHQGDAGLAESLHRQALSMVFSLGGFPVLRARLHNNLGVVLSQAGRTSEALREFSLALHLVRGRVDEDTRFHQALAANRRQAATNTPALAA